MSIRGNDERKGFGSVKAAIDFYKGKVPMKYQTNDFETEPPSKTGELHRARRRSGLLQDAKGVAESVRSKAETELLNAKKMVKELRKRIQESESRAKAQIEDMGKLQKARGVRRDHAIALKGDEEPLYNRVMEELEKEKHELSKLKVNMTSLLEEKRKAEKERETLNRKAQHYIDLVKALTNEVEECNEEHVLVELARLEAAKEMKAIELQKQEATQQYFARMEKTRKKLNSMIKETSRIGELQRLLELTSTEANVLGNELKEFREIDMRSQRVQPDYTALLQSTMEELQEAKKKLESKNAETIQLMVSMDALRNEIKAIMEETDRLTKKEANTELIIQNLNSKLLRGKDKVEAASASRNKAELIVSNLITILEKYTSEAEALKNERIVTMEKTTAYKSEVTKIESEIDSAEEKFQAALEELKSVKSSEAGALQNLKSSTQKTMQNRASASLHSSTITISTFEYKYLTRSAESAADIANKKIAAAQAWVGALKASEKEILMKTESSQRGKELRVKEEQGVVRTEHLLSANSSFEPQLENSRQNFGDMEESSSQLTLSRKSMTGKMKLTPARRVNFQKPGSPAVRTRPASFSIKKRTKVMPNLMKFLSGKSVQENLEAM